MFIAIAIVPSVTVSLIVTIVKKNQNTSYCYFELFKSQSVIVQIESVLVVVDS